MSPTIRVAFPLVKEKHLGSLHELFYKSKSLLISLPPRTKTTLLDNLSPKEIGMY